MIFLGIILSIAAIGFFCWLLFTLAVFALPLFAGVTAGGWAYQTGAGWLGAILIGTRYKGRIQLVSGSDDIAWDFMHWGADSWICGPANCMAKPVCEMDAAFRKGDHARAKAIMETVWPAMNVLESGKFVQKLKYGCELLGNPVGECRMPLGPLTEAEKAEFAEAMQVVVNWK